VFFGGGKSSLKRHERARRELSLQTTESNNGKSDRLFDTKPIINPHITTMFAAMRTNKIDDTDMRQKRIELFTNYFRASADMGHDMYCCLLYSYS
jgi:hypothetical protein